MTSAINAAKKLTDESDKNWMPMLKESTLHLVFRPIYKLDLNISQANLLVSLIIFSYDPDSEKINLKKERHDNKLRIAESIGLDVSNEIIEQVLNNSHEEVNNVILEYLKELTDWRWQTCLTLLDYHSNIMRFVNQRTNIEKRTEKTDKEGDTKIIEEEFDLSEISKINKEKGLLIQQAIDAREQADEILRKIKTDFVLTDNSTQQDFGFAFSDTAKNKVDIESWKEWIAHKNKSA